MSVTPESQRTVPFGRPWISSSEREAVARVLAGHILTHGPECKAFEEEFSAFVGDGGHSVTTSSCMASLHLSHIHLGLQAGDEVVVPAQTHVATAHAVEWAGATPVFADCESETGNLTAESIERCITPRTRAISVVHFNGIPCEMPAIIELAQAHGLAVVEDCATAVGARYDGRHVGLFGDTGCFSFYPVKHITTAEGGMLISRRAEVVEGITRLRAFGVDRRHDERTIPGVYDVPELGLNYRMSEVHAAIGRAQLARFEENLQRREANFNTLKAAVADLEGVRILDIKNDRFRNSFYCFTLVLDADLAEHRPSIVAELGASGVGTSLYYPQPVPRMTYYREKYGYDATLYPNATEISDRSIALPVGPHLEPEDASYVAETLVACLERVR